MIEHALLPWTSTDNDVWDSNGVRICTSHGPRSDEEKIANAEFIALACNAHDELLAALEDMLHRFGHLDTDAGKREACESARAAIALAEGGAT
jgi:hypothetical protein